MHSIYVAVYIVVRDDDVFNIFVSFTQFFSITEIFRFIELHNGHFDGYEGGAFIQPVKCYENPYNLKGKGDGIYYKGAKVGDL